LTRGDPNIDDSIVYRINALATSITKLETIVETLISANGEPTKLNRIYRDYFNEIYFDTTQTIEYSDVMLLDSGLSAYTIPEDTYKIVMGVDVQKDRCYYVVTAYSYNNIAFEVDKGEVYGYGIGEDWIRLKEIFLDRVYETPSGVKLPIHALGCDVRGYIDREDDADRPLEAKTFVKELQEELEITGETDRHVFAMIGVDSITGGKLFRLTKEKFKRADRVDDDEESEIIVMAMNNLLVKTDLFEYMNRTILKEKAVLDNDQDNVAFKYRRKLFYIDHDTIEETKKILGDGKPLKMNHYIRHLMSEQYDPKQNRWIKVSKRNDYLDCHAMAHCIAHWLNVPSVVPPSTSEDADKEFNEVLSMFG
jgi:hypothetical protein